MNEMKKTDGMKSKDGQRKTGSEHFQMKKQECILKVCSEMS